LIYILVLILLWLLDQGGYDGNIQTLVKDFGGK